MSPELDQQLCEKYPKIFADRNKSIRESCMAWGFDIGDGWFNIIDTLCANIQNHINHSRLERARALRYNRALKRALNNDRAGLEHFYSYKTGKLSSFGITAVNEDIQKAQFKQVPKKVQQVIAEQVKEKFGGLRFYYRGGDSVIDGMVRVAESMSYRTCESCGNPAKITGHGWLVTLCDPCKTAKEQQRQRELAAYNAMHAELYNKFERKEK